MENFGEMTDLHLNHKKTVVMPVLNSDLEPNFGELGFTTGDSLNILEHSLDQTKPRHETFLQEAFTCKDCNWNPKMETNDVNPKGEIEHYQMLPI